MHDDRDELYGYGADQRYGLYVYGDGDEQCGHEFCVGCECIGDPGGDGPGRTNGGDCDGR